MSGFGKFYPLSLRMCQASEKRVWLSFGWIHIRERPSRRGSVGGGTEGSAPPGPSIKWENVGNEGEKMRKKGQSGRERKEKDELKK